MPTPTVPVTTFELPSHCIVTISTGTTYTPKLYRTDVHTRLAIRFDGAYPLIIKGIRERDEWRGFDLTVTGTDELEQLIRALETAATELRIQAGYLSQEPSTTRTLEEEIAASQAAQADARVDVAYTVQSTEVNVIELLATEAGSVLPEAGLVVDYLLAQLREEPLATLGCAELWQLAQQARATEELPTLAWLGERATTEGQRILQRIVWGQEHLRQLSPGLRAKLPPVDLKRNCDHVVAVTQRAHVMRERTELLDQIQKADEEHGMMLIERLQTLSKRYVKLTDRMREVYPM